MTEDEALLKTLTDAWAQAHSRFAVSGATGDRQFWSGLIAGLAVAIAAVSGLPKEGIGLSAAIRAGSDIALARCGKGSP